MANKEKLTPADYDRWGRTCVKFHEETPTQTAKLKMLQITNKEEVAAIETEQPPHKATI